MQGQQTCPRCHEAIQGEVTFTEQGTLDGCTPVRKMRHTKANGHPCSAHVGVPVVGAREGDLAPCTQYGTVVRS